MTARELSKFELARRASLRSDYPRYQLGAVISRKGRVLGTGCNRRKTHTRSPSPWRYLHAEIDAALGIPVQELYGAHVYVYRALASGRPGLSRPCVHCARYLRGLGISRVYYTTDSGYTWEAI